MTRKQPKYPRQPGVMVRISVELSNLIDETIKEVRHRTGIDMTKRGLIEEGAKLQLRRARELLLGERPPETP